MSPRYLFRLVTAFFIRFGWIIVVGIIIGIATFALFRFVLPLVTVQSERIGIVGRFQTDELPNVVLADIGEGLTTLDENLQVQSGLAKEWKVSADGKTWTFILASGNKWHDGKEVESKDINYEFADVVVEHPDSSTVVFKLTDPFSAFPTVVSKPIFKKGLLGTGEFVVDKVRVSSGFVHEIVLISPKKLKKVIRFYPTEDAAKNAFKMGKLDTLAEILNPQPFDEWDKTTLTPVVDSKKIVLLFFNTQDEAVGDKFLRQALTYAIKKEELGERAFSPIVPTSWAYNPVVKKYEFSYERAQELYDTLPSEITDDLQISLVTTPALLEVAEKIEADWEEFGIPTTVQVASGFPTDYQVYLAIFEPPADPDQYALWHSTQTDTNITKYASPRIDKLLEDGRTELNLDARKSIYLDMQRFLVEDTPAAFLYHPTFYTVSR